MRRREFITLGGRCGVAAGGARGWPDLLWRTTMPLGAGGVIGYGHRPSRWSMRQRDFIILVSGAVAAFPLTARAPAADQADRCGVGLCGAYPAAQSDVAALRSALSKLGEGG